MSHRPDRPVRQRRPREVEAPGVHRPPLSRSARAARGVVAAVAALTVVVAVLGGYVDPDQRPSGDEADQAGGADRAALSGSVGTPGPQASAGPGAPVGPVAPAPTPTDPAPPAEPAPDAVPPSAQGGVLPSGPAATIGVASYNVFGYRAEDGIAADLQRLTGRDDVDVIGWQETDLVGDLFPALDAQGWATRYVPGGGGEVAISWRRSEFALVDARSVRVVRGAEAPQTPKAFPDRFVTSVVLRHKATGERLTVFNTHLPQYIENLADPGTWRRNLNAVRAKKHLAALADLWRAADTRWVLGTGDFNFDYRSDSRARPDRGIGTTLEGVATSSYEALGLKGLPPTHTLSQRWIDYVLAGQAGLDAGHLAFRSERVLQGYGSDHQPLLVRVALS